jgi:hypothetical protein
MKFKTYKRMVESGLGGLAGAFGALGGQKMPDDDEYDEPTTVDQEPEEIEDPQDSDPQPIEQGYDDELPKKKAVVFDFYGPLFHLKPDYEDILLRAAWVDYPIHVNRDFNPEEWEELFVLVPDEVYAKARANEAVVMNEELIHGGRYERNGIPPEKYTRKDNKNGIRTSFGPGEITEETVEFFSQNFPQERFIRVAPQYHAFIMKGWGNKENSAREKYFSEYATSVLSPEKFKLLHTMGPAINMLKDIDLSETDVHIIATYDGDDEINFLIAEILSQFGFKLHPINDIHLAGYSRKNTLANEIKSKVDILQRLREEHGYEDVTLVDDNYRIANSKKHIGPVAKGVLVTHRPDAGRKNK